MGEEERAEILRKILETAAKKRGAGKSASVHASQVLQKGTSLSDEFVSSSSEQLQQSDEVQDD